jgi:hypothetical protein
MNPPWLKTPWLAENAVVENAEPRKKHNPQMVRRVYKVY